MSHVVLQAASFPTPAEAQRAEEELQKLFDAYVAFESSDPEPWRQDRVPPPLVDFGRAHGVEWPLRDDARFLLKGAFAEAAQLMRVDRLVFFWGGGFELGGTTLRAILAKLGASVTPPTDATSGCAARSRMTACESSSSSSKTRTSRTSSRSTTKTPTRSID